jgi:hypothetical protein
MKPSAIHLFRPAAFALAALFGSAPLAALAQADAPSWAAPYYDVSSHVLRGVITNAAPYRITLQLGRNGRTLAIDLKNGTTISPTGTTLTPGMHVRIHGYWSNGTFIANRVRLR